MLFWSSSALFILVCSLTLVYSSTCLISSLSTPSIKYELKSRERNIPTKASAVFGNSEDVTQSNEEQERSVITYSHLENLRDELEDLRCSIFADDRIENGTIEIQERIHSLEDKDPEYMYASLIDQAKNEPDKEKSWNLHQLGLKYRNRLPHFNLSGVWVGKYGEESGSEKYDFVEVTYDGDTLIAMKKTGNNRNIPINEVSFNVDLSPSCYSSESLSECLLPVELPSDIARKWNGKLARFPGRGQIADEGFQNSEWVKGELIMADETHFVFIWKTIQHQIFFTRPPRHLLG